MRDCLKMAVQVKQTGSLSLKSHNNFHKQMKSNLVFTNIRFSSLQVNATSGKVQQLIESGIVKPILPKDAASAMESDGFILLDIRPVWERQKAHVSGSHHVPLFVEDPDNGLLTLLKKWVHFGYIGLWTGQNFTMINSEFLQQVENKFPSKDSKILVACGEGLRSRVAVTKLYGGGYSKLGWLAGGFNRAVDGDFVDVPRAREVAVCHHWRCFLFLSQAHFIDTRSGKEDHMIILHASLTFIVFCYASLNGWFNTLTCSILNCFGLTSIGCTKETAESTNKGFVLGILIK